MSGANVIVRKLLDTGSDTAIGIGHVLQALLSAAQSSGKMPITVEHTDRGTTRVMMFSRQTLSTPFHVSLKTNMSCNCRLQAECCGNYQI